MEIRDKSGVERGIIWYEFILSEWKTGQSECYVKGVFSKPLKKYNFEFEIQKRFPKK